MEVGILAQGVRVSHIMGKCLGFFNILLDIQGFVSNPYQPPALSEPACGLNCTALLKERQEAPAKHLCSFLHDALCACPAASSTGCGWAEICLDLKFPMGGEKMNTCKNHRKVQSELNNQDTGI